VKVHKGVYLPPLALSVGIGLGQLLVLLAASAAPGFVFAHALAARFGVLILSGLLAHTGWHWMLERTGALRKVPWPRLDTGAVTVLARCVVGILPAIAAVRLHVRFARSLSRRSPAEQ
jgi:hypothetical protein